MSKFFVLRVDAADPDDEHTVYLDGRPHIVSSARQVANDFASRPIPGARTLKEALAAARRMRTHPQPSAEGCDSGSRGRRRYRVGRRPSRL